MSTIYFAKGNYETDEKGPATNFRFGHPADVYIERATDFKADLYGTCELDVYQTFKLNGSRIYIHVAGDPFVRSKKVYHRRNRNDSFSCIRGFLYRKQR